LEAEETRVEALLAAENALRTRLKDEEAHKDEQVKRLEKNIGELVLDLDTLKGTTKDPAVHVPCRTGRRRRYP
jgi:hypothetical protein